MAENEYNDIVFLEKLNEIKTTIHNSGFRVDYKRAYQVDQQMREVIDQLYDKNRESSPILDLFHILDIRVNRRINYTLVYFYYALYQDNLSLLKKMLTEDIGLFDEEDRFAFILLDREFTKHFSEDQYLFLLRNCREELLSFYHMTFSRNHSKMNMAHRRELLKEMNGISLQLFSSEKPPSLSEKTRLEERLEEIANELNESYYYQYSKEEREKYTKMFASIMTKKPFICKKEEDESDSNIYSHLLSPEVLSLYGEEKILQMGDTEKKFVSNYEGSPFILERVKQIFEKYPDYDTPIRLDPVLLRTFTDDELYSLPRGNVLIYEKAMGEGILTRLRKIAEKNQSVLQYPGFVHHLVFDTLSDEEITGLSDRAVSRISHLVMNSHFINPEEEYRLQRSSRRVMRMDQIIQKVKKILR